MAWDTEATKRRILDAAVAEFAAHGLDGTTIERIAGVAGVNKERIYNYFGGKRDLFAHVLRDELVKVAQAVAKDSTGTACATLTSSSRSTWANRSRLPPK
ncbi:TetR/AcrR family transcriptional regulator [Arachnia propionica]|uniref:TetR/AcrR family transcriptional regulator n=1 Tax=Arachnia propionica TaxID=1750 RepID=UPI003C6F0954